MYQVQVSHKSAESMATILEVGFKTIAAANAFIVKHGLRRNMPADWLAVQIDTMAAI